MILFYKKDTGKIFAVVDGRVHDEFALQCRIDDGTPQQDIGKYVIGWIQKGEDSIDYNLDKMALLEEFESVSSTSPLEYIVDIQTGNLIKSE
jgi:hypothetical protein